jgi:ferric enterobactin receptor
LDENQRLDLINIALQQKALSGEEVTITSENLQTIELAKEPSQIRVSPIQIQNMPAIGAPDLLRSMQMLPGISGLNDGSTGIYIRGGTPDQNLILLDGMPIYHIDHFLGFVSAFNTDAIKDVRAMKGAFPAKFGGRLSGILELTGKAGNSNAFQAGVSFNTLSGSAMIQVPINKRGGWLLSFRRSYSEIMGNDLYIDIMNALRISGRESEPSGPRLQNNNNQAQNIIPDFYYYDLNSKFSYMLSNRDLVSVSFYRGSDFLDQSQVIRAGHNGNQGNHENTNIEDITEYGNTGFSGKWSRRWNDRLYSNFLIANTYYSSESQRSGNFQPDDSLFFSSFEHTNVQNLDVRFDNEWQFTPSHRMEFGGQISRTHIDNNFISDESVQILDQDQVALENVLYVEDRWRITDQLEITLGLRSTYYNPTGRFYTEPRTGFNFELGENFYLKGAWGKYYQFIYRISNESILEGNRDLWLVADENLKPGSSGQKVLGIGYKKKGYLFDVEGYYKDLSNLAEFAQVFRRAPDDRPGSIFYLGKGRSYGIEFFLQKKTGWLTGWLGYTLGKVDYKIPEINRGKWYPASQDRRHEINFVASHMQGNWRFSFTGMYGSGLPYSKPNINQTPTPGMQQQQVSNTTNNDRLPAYRRIDVGISYNFLLAGLDWSTGISLYNLLNNENVWARQFNFSQGRMTTRDIKALGFTPTLNVSINFKQSTR